MEPNIAPDLNQDFFDELSSGELTALESTGAEGALKRLSHTHDLIMNWMLQNPEKNLRECAAHFQYTQAWLSRIIHSDIFQAKLKARQDAVFLAVAQDIPVKLKGLADTALEKLSEQLEKSENPEFIKDVFESTLDRMGYSPKATAPAAALQINNTFQVSAADLAQARGQIISSPHPALNDASSNQPSMGEVFVQPAAISTGD